MQNIRQIKIGGKIKYAYQYNDIAKADAWLDRMKAKQDGDFLPAHTVEDIDNPEAVKRQEAIAAFQNLPTDLKVVLKYLYGELK